MNRRHDKQHLGNPLKVLIILAIPALIVAFQPEVAHARWQLHRTECTNIWYDDEETLETLFKRVHFRSISRSLLRLFGGGSEYSEEKLSEEVDGLLKQVGAILEMPTEHVTVNIKVYKDKRRMKEAFPALKRRMPIAFYSPGTNTIYVSLDTLNAGILAHELAHAVFMHCDRPVPMQTQERLAQLVDLNT